MEKRTPFFLTNLLRRSPKNPEVIEEKGWINTPQDTSFNGWGSSLGFTSSGPITNGWTHDPPSNHKIGWDSDSMSRPQSVIKVSNGRAYEKSKDEYNGWGSGLGSGSDGKCTTLEESSNGWMMDKLPKDDYNDWNSSNKCKTSKEMSDGLMDELPESEPIRNASRTLEIKSWAPVPSAPPLPDEGLSENSMANASEYSHFDFMEKDAVPMNQGNNGDPICVVCWEVPIEGACIPCGHMASCMTCLHEIESKQGTCPVCRAKIDNIMRIYAISTE